jgi:hypothetical protein
MIRNCLLTVGMMALLSAPAIADDTAGTVKRVSGTVEIERDASRLKAEPGMSVQVADKVRTGADGAIGITLKDETLLSAGPNTILDLDGFRFNQTDHSGAMRVSIKRGKLAVNTGKLAKASPESVEFHTPDSILGVRGTEFVLDVAGKDAD